MTAEFVRTPKLDSCFVYYCQAQHQSLQAAAEEAAAAGGGFYRLDSGAALAAHGLGGGSPYGDLQQQANMLELLGLLRAVHRPLLMTCFKLRSLFQVGSRRKD